MEFKDTICSMAVGYSSISASEPDMLNHWDNGGLGGLQLTKKNTKASTLGIQQSISKSLD